MSLAQAAFLAQNCCVHIPFSGLLVRPFLAALQVITRALTPISSWCIRKFCHVSMLIGMNTSPGVMQVITKALDRFEREEGVRVMLMPARTTAAGLTLTRASRIILLEPAPDPAIPQQVRPPPPSHGACWLQILTPSAVRWSQADSN